MRGEMTETIISFFLFSHLIIFHLLFLSFSFCLLACWNLILRLRDFRNTSDESWDVVWSRRDRKQICLLNYENSLIAGAWGGRSRLVSHDGIFTKNPENIFLLELLRTLAEFSWIELSWKFLILHNSMKQIPKYEASWDRTSMFSHNPADVGWESMGAVAWIVFQSIPFPVFKSPDFPRAHSQIKTETKKDWNM